MKKSLILFFTACLLIVGFALCINAQSEDDLMSDIFTFRGYSTSENGKGSLAIGFGIDYEAIEKYESTFGVTLSYGVVFANYDSLNGNAPLDSQGNPIAIEGAKSFKADLTEYDSQIFDFIITNIEDAHKDLKLVISAYINDGNTTKYVQDNGISDNVASITYNEAYAMTQPVILTDDKGFTYELYEGELKVISFDRVIDSSITNGITVPMEYEGYTVTAIGENAFTSFGEKFTKTSYANLSSGFVMLRLPTTVTVFENNAFDKLFCVDVELYDNTGIAPDYKAWDKTVEWGEGNIHARDCIWNIRPAMGWTRYSNAVIPEDYE